VRTKHDIYVFTMDTVVVLIAIVWLCSDISYNILQFSHSNVMYKIYTIMYSYTLVLVSLLDLVILMST
jgi:hypothetical protein